MEMIDLEDMKYLSYAEWISGDYNDFVKRSILPEFNSRYDLKIREVRVLNSIAELGPDKSASDISDHLRQDPATVTRSLVKLIGNGYVVSFENFNDGRSRLLKTTDKGKEASAYFMKIFTFAINQLASGEVDASAHYDRDAITRSLKLVSMRAKTFRESQRRLARLLKDRTIELTGQKT